MKSTGRILFLIMILPLGSCCERLYNLTTVSPKKTYVIQLTETKTETSFQNTLPYKVFLHVERGGVSIVNSDILYSGDGWDARFGTIASEAEWIDEKIVRFGRRKFDAAQQYDWIEFHNN